VRLHPGPQLPAPLDFAFFFKVAPAALITMFLSGNISAAFYALGPVYVVNLTFSTAEVALFMSTAVVAGLLAQWPIGWLSDRLGRERLIRINALVLAGITVLLWGWLTVPYWMLLIVAAVSGVVQFTLYPLAGSYANDLVPGSRRVSLSAVLIISYAVGARLGPLICGYIMRAAGVNMFYVFMTGCSLLLILNTYLTGRLNARYASQRAR
jgi:MFS family permease